MPHHPDRFATISVAHVAAAQDRAEALRKHPGTRVKRSIRPETCELVGHAWAVDEGRHGWLICLACDVVRQS